MNERKYMFEDTQEHNAQETAVEEVTQEHDTQEEVTQEHNAQEQPKQDPEGYQARNFRELREKNERIELERNEALRRLQEIEQAKSIQEHNAQEEPEYNVGADDLVEGKHLGKYDRNIKKLEKKIESYEQQTKEFAAEAKLKAQYPDFDKVVSKDTIASLKELHPEIAETINSSSNLYSKAVSAYTMIKNLGIYKENTYQKEKELIQQNNAKPRSVASVAPQQGDSPLSRANAFANGLTEDLKTQLRKEMEIARKGY